MNKRNRVKQLNRDSTHRKAMINNMVASLFKYERIESTIAKVKVVRSFAEKMITRAKGNLGEVASEVALHNKRIIMKSIKDRDIIVKLFDDIAHRFENRNGGYTRIIKLRNRPSDNSEVALLELVTKKEKEDIKDTKPKKEKKVSKKPAAVEGKEKKKSAKKDAKEAPKAEEKKKRSFFGRKEKKES